MSFGGMPVRSLQRSAARRRAPVSWLVVTLAQLEHPRKSRESHVIAPSKKDVLERLIMAYFVSSNVGFKAEMSENVGACWSI